MINMKRIINNNNDNINELKYNNSNSYYNNNIQKTDYDGNDGYKLTCYTKMSIIANNLSTPTPSSSLILWYIHIHSHIVIQRKWQNLYVIHERDEKVILLNSG